MHLLPVTIDTMLNFNGEFDGYGNGQVKCKQTWTFWIWKTAFFLITARNEVAAR